MAVRLQDSTDFACYAFAIVPPSTPASEILFYDGHCGLCHRTVLFVIKHDRSGDAFRFAPLQGETFLARVPAERRVGLPDSMVVLTEDEKLLVRSEAIIHILRQLGGGWGAIAEIIGIVPRSFRDCAYNLVARVRYRVFGKREELCPITPPELRARFDT